MTPADLHEYGLIPEFVGRWPVLVNMHDLSQEHLVRVLIEPKNSLISQYKELLRFDKVTLDFTQGALEEIARQAIEKKAGARGLRAIIEKLMRDLMFEAPDKNLKTFTITEEMVNGNEKLFADKAA